MPPHMIFQPQAMWPNLAPQAAVPQLYPAMQEISVATPIIFTGDEKAHNKGALTPDGFLAEIESRRTKSGWDDATTMRFVRSCLRGSANLWLEHELDLMATTPQLVQKIWQIRNNWLEFHNAFQAKFGLGGIVHRLHWPDTIKQHPKETVSAYIHRATYALKLHLKSTRRAMAEKMFFAPDRNIVLNAITDPVQRALADAAFPAYEAIYPQEANTRAIQVIYDLFMLQVLVDGLHREPIRKYALKLVDEGYNSIEMWEKVKVQADGPLSGQNPTVPAMAVETTEDPHSVEAVNKPTKKKRAITKKKKAPAPPSSPPTSKKSSEGRVRCEYCNFWGHHQDNCNVKERHRQAATAAVSAIQQTQAPINSQPQNPPQGNGAGW